MVKRLTTDILQLLAAVRQSQSVSVKNKRADVASLHSRVRIAACKQKKTYVDKNIAYTIILVWLMVYASNYVIPLVASS